MVEVGASRPRTAALAHDVSDTASQLAVPRPPATVQPANLPGSSVRIARYPASHFDPPRRDAYDVVDGLPSTDDGWKHPASGSVLHVQHNEDEGEHKSDEEKGLLHPGAQVGTGVAAGSGVASGSGMAKGGVLQNWRQNKRALLVSPSSTYCLDYGALTVRSV